MQLRRRLSVLLLVLMAAQALLGRLFPNAYRDVEWIRATWIGNDWITLVVAAPLLLLGLLLAGRGSSSGFLLWMGGVAYAVYNACFYVFGAVLNAFFPLYCLIVVLAAAIMILALSKTDPRALAAKFSPKTPVRLIGGFLVFTAIGLTAVWMVTWGAYAFFDQPTPVETSAFQVVAALDLVLMVPALGVGGALLWARHPWGFVIATIAAIQAALYLLILTLNSVILIRLGLTEAPGELPIWLPLLLGTSLSAATLLIMMNRHAIRA